MAAIALFYLSFGTAVRRAALATSRLDVERRAGLEDGALVAEINKFRVLPFVLTELPNVGDALVRGSPVARAQLNATLEALARQTGASSIYAIDQSGIARSASNWHRPDSFVGHDFRFRPYFLGAMRYGADEYFAEGAVTGRPGLFLARRAGTAARPKGVIVVKIEFDAIERLWRSDGRPSFVVDRDGIVIISTDRRLRYRTIGALARQRLEEIRRTRQFGLDAFRSARFRFEDGGVVRDASGARYLVAIRPLPLLGWRQILLEPEQPVIGSANARVRLATLLVALAIVAALALSFWVATRRKRLLAARLALEVEVDRRTAELSQAYASLQREAEQRNLADSRYRAAREELAQANRLGMIGTITTSVAHELNQPVAAIRTTAENATKLLARGQADKVAGNLALIVSLTQRIGTITGELLSYGRRGQHGSVAVRLEDALDGALLLIGDSFHRAEVDLQVVRPATLPRLPIARIRLEQILVNLLQNARDAAGGRAGAAVRLEIVVEDGFVRVTLSDNGPGIAATLGETVFQPFVTTKAHGTGLGLGIARGIVQDHGGTLTIVPSPLGGAAFRASLPLEKGNRR